MASEFCNISPTDSTKTILSLLPPLPSINQIVDLINTEVNNVKTKFIAKATELLLGFGEGFCPSPQQINSIIRTRNNIVEQLTKVYNKVDRLSNNISGVSNFLTLILTAIKTVSGIARGLAAGSIISPFPIPGAISSGISAAQGEVEKFKFKADGAQKLVPITGGLISANIAVKLFASSLRELICTLEALDIAIIECSSPTEGETPTQEQIERLQEVQDSLIPIPTELILFIEQDVAEQEESIIETAYRVVAFEIEEVPFSPTVNRRRALAKNPNGITLLQTELSFTSSPDILIQELKLIIDRDNLRAE